VRFYKEEEKNNSDFAKKVGRGPELPVYLAREPS
jgi:hypothetical protein